MGETVRQHDSKGGILCFCLRGIAHNGKGGKFEYIPEVFTGKSNFPFPFFYCKLEFFAQSSYFRRFPFNGQRYINGFGKIFLIAFESK